MDIKEAEIVRAHIRTRLRQLQRHVDKRICAGDGESASDRPEALKKKARRDA